MMSRCGTLAAALLAAAAGSAHAQDSSKLDLDAMARVFLEEYGREDARPDAGLFLEVLDGEGWARLPLGTLMLRIPTSSLASSDVANELKATAENVITLQRTWTRWTDPALAGDATLEAHWDTLEKWVRSWSATKLRGAQGDLYAALHAKDDVVAAAEELHRRLKPDEETIEKLGEWCQVVLAPTRRDFLATVAFGCWLDPEERERRWTDDLATQTFAWCGWNEVVAMENGKVPVDFDNPYQSVSMNDRDKTKLQQFLVDRAAVALLRKHFWRQGTHFFEEALGTNLVIAVVGRNDLLPGSWTIASSGGSTAPYSRFVPGGNPAGGVLPPRKASSTTTGDLAAVSRWRETQGADYFVGPLREGQKDGARLASKDSKNELRREKDAHFALESFDSSSECAVTAPFLGKPADDKPLPPLEFLDEYEDFFRAYRSSFLRWLQDHGTDRREASRALFADLCQKQALRGEEQLLDDVVQAVYGVPLSAPDPSVDSLEWRYLDWLDSKSKL